ncbi:hypothetical protein H8B02_42975 [Bradyrhizobium sp. Pear77]|uniref:hypothetical protein n=1 Tax=Bradyrhizobium altum TaxID=1571202 RepID=UPI001E43C4F1|nr:hypothetical protein [Bradyrhizobium altum]MCC8959934.1 hypothetical protein [Bradyrhizobium altum]
MAWTWRWWIFFGLLIPAVIAAAIARGATNNQNIARREKGDFLYAFATRPGSTISGTLMAGAICSAIITAVAGFLV